VYKKASDAAEQLKTLLSDKDTTATVSGIAGAGGGVPPQFQDRFGGGGFDRFGGGGGFGGGGYYDPTPGGGCGPGGARRGPAGGGGPTVRVKSVAIVVDAKTNSVTITAPPEKIALAKKIIEDMDKPSRPGDGPIKIEEPILQKYSVPPGSADAVVKTLQAGDP